MSVDLANEELHREVDALEIPRSAPYMNYRVMLIHALIDADVITELKCMHPHCRLPDVPFKKAAHGRDDEAVQIDHIVPLASGGTHWPSNLRIVHGKCNRSGYTRPGMNRDTHHMDKVRRGDILVVLPHERVPSFLHGQYVYATGAPYFSGGTAKGVRVIPLDDDVRRQVPQGIGIWARALEWANPDDIPEYDPSDLLDSYL